MSIVGAAIVGYFFGVSKDRLSAIRNKQIEVGSDLLNKILDIGEMELSVGDSERLTIRVVSGDQRTQDLDSEEVEHLQKLIKWRRDIEREERRANMWIHGDTVAAVRSYRLLMMHCRAWEDGGQPGRLITEDYWFKYFLMRIFGKQWKKRVEEVTERYQNQGNPRNGEPWLLDMTALSLRCLDDIQKRLFSEIKHPTWFRLREIVRFRNLNVLLSTLRDDQSLRYEGTSD